MKSYARVFAVCAIFALTACDLVPEDSGKNNKRPVPEIVGKLCEQSPIFANKVRNCYKHISNELQTVRADAATGIEKCTEAIHEDIFSTYEAVEEYISSIQENLRLTREIFETHCAKASGIEYFQCIADSLEESQNSRSAIKKDIAEIRKVVAPRVGDVITSSKKCIRSVFVSAVKNASEIRCQSEN